MSDLRRSTSIIRVAAILLAIAAVVFAATFFCLSHDDATDRAKDEARKAVSAYGRKGSVGEKKAARRLTKKRVKGLKAKSMARRDLDAAKLRAKLRTVSKGNATVDIPENPLTDDERRILEAANEAVSERDMVMAQKVAAEALKSADPRVRTAAVETLSNFGEAGLPELADFLIDKDPEVAALAADRFELCAQEISDDREIAAVIKLAMLTVNDPDKLASFGGTMMLCADQQVVISALSDVIAQGTPNQASAAKDVYANTTGDEWTSPEAAQTWLKENFEPIEYDDAPKNHGPEIVDET